MSQDFIQNYLNEVNSIRKEMYYYTSKFDIKYYNEQLQELYVETFNKENFVPKTKEEIYHELCGDARDAILQYQINESEEVRNNRYKEYCHNIWFFNLNDEENDVEEEEFETENDHPLNTYALYLDRLYKNPCTTKELLEKTHYEDVFMIEKSNKDPKLSDFISVPIVKPWGLTDIVEKVYEHASKEFCSFNREENIMRSTNRRYFRDGKILSSGLSKSIVDNKIYAEKSINSKKVKVHRDLFKAFIGKNCNPEMINHVDGDIHDSVLINFEASNASHNRFHAIYELGKGNAIKVKRFDLENELNIYVFDSIKDAAKDAKYDPFRFSMNVRTKGFCDSKNKKYRYVYNDSTYVPSKRIVLNKLPKGCKQVILIKQEGKENSPFGEKNIYYASDEGEMFKQIGKEMFYKLKTYIIGGYVHLFMTDDNGKTKQYQMHRIVLIVHLNGQTGRSDKHQDYTKLFVDHKNKIRSDNRKENLQFVTASENNLLAFGLKPLIMLSIEKCTFDMYRYNKSKGNILYDGLFADVRVVDNFLNSNITAIQSAAANNRILHNYIFDYVSDEFYEKYKNNQSDIHVKKGNTVALQGTMRSLKTGRTFTFDSLHDAESTEKLGVKEGQMLYYYQEYNISKLSGIELENGTVHRNFIFTKIQEIDGYKVRPGTEYENITIEVLDIEGIKGKPLKCWITSNIDGIVERREFANATKACEKLNLNFAQIKDFVKNNKHKCDKILCDGQVFRKYKCCKFKQSNSKFSLKSTIIYDSESFECVVNDVSEIKFKGNQTIGQNQTFELIYPCKYQNK